MRKGRLRLAACASARRRSRQLLRLRAAGARVAAAHTKPAATSFAAARGKHGAPTRVRRQRSAASRFPSRPRGACAPRRRLRVVRRPGLDGAHDSWSDAPEETAAGAPAAPADVGCRDRAGAGQACPGGFHRDRANPLRPDRIRGRGDRAGAGRGRRDRGDRPVPPQASFAGLLLALALALSLPLCVLALAASAVWRRRAPPAVAARETPINERYATRTEPEPASELVEMDAATRRVHREARAASLEAEKLRRILHRWRDSPRRPPWRRSSRRAGTCARRSSSGGTASIRDDAVAVETPLVKEVRFDAAQTPASAIVSESDGDSPVVVAASPPRKLYLDAPAPRNRSAAVAWVLLAAFIARATSRLEPASGPPPTPRPSMEPTYVRASMELVDDIAMVPAIAPPMKVALRPLAIAKAALAPMAISATVAAVLPPRLQAALGLHALHALDRLRRLAVAAAAPSRAWRRKRRVPRARRQRWPWRPRLGAPV